MIERGNNGRILSFCHTINNVSWRYAKGDNAYSLETEELDNGD